MCYLLLQQEGAGVLRLFGLRYREIYLLRFIFCYCTSIYKKYVILLCFICDNHRTLLISKLLNQFPCDIFKDNFLLQTSKSTKSQKRLLPTHSKHWKTEPYRGSDDRGEVDCDSDLNRLASVILSQYTTVTNQCWWFSCTWTFLIQYCDCWSHFGKLPIWV